MLLCPVLIHETSRYKALKWIFLEKKSYKNAVAGERFYLRGNLIVALSNSQNVALFILILKVEES